MQALSIVPFVGTAVDGVSSVRYFRRGNFKKGFGKLCEAGIGLGADVFTAGSTRAGAKAIQTSVKGAVRVGTKYLAKEAAKICARATVVIVKGLAKKSVATSMAKKVTQQCFDNF